MKKIVQLRKHFKNWYLRIFERFGLVKGDVTYYVRDPELAFTFGAKQYDTPLWILEDMLYFKPYESEYFSLGDKPVIFDFGANLGFYSCAMAKRFPHARIVAVEAHPQNFEYLKKNIIQNGLEDRITAVHAAVVGTARKTVTIHDHASDVGSHSLIAEKEGVTGTAHEVPAITVDALLKEYAIDTVDFLKMDIEGGEYDIVKNGQEVFPKIRNLAMEYHVIPGEQVEDMRMKLESFGFKISNHSANIWHGVR